MRSPGELLGRVEDHVDAIADRIEDLIQVESPNSRKIVHDEIREAVVSAIVKVNREQSFYDLEEDSDGPSTTDS
jgi:hypothetical protein